MTTMSDSDENTAVKTETDLCNLCDKNHSLKVDDGCFDHHHLLLLEECKGSLRPPSEIYIQPAGTDGRKWGSCRKCSKTMRFGLTEKGEVEKHFLDLLCPGTGKKPVDVQAVPGNLQLQPEPRERHEDVVRQRQAWLTQYSKPLQEALEAAEGFVPTNYAKLMAGTSTSDHVTCLVDSRWEVTDFSSFIQGVFFIGVRRGRKMLKDKISEESAELSEKLLKRCKKISQENRQYTEVSLEGKLNMPAWNMKVFMLEAYGVRNLSRKANLKPQLVNDRKYSLTEPEGATKEQYGLQLLYKIWQRMDRAGVGALTGAMGNLNPRLE